MLKLIKSSNILLWSVVAHTCDYVPVTKLTCNTLICEKKHCTMTEREKIVNKLEREKFQPPYNKSVSKC